MTIENFNTNELTNYWKTSAERDYKTMLNLYKSRDYHWALFIGHLVIEKLLKGLYIKEKQQHPIFTHDLLRLAKACELELNENQVDMLDIITNFNINARYDNVKQDFYKLCTKEFTEKWIKNIKELYEWLMKQF